MATLNGTIRSLNAAANRMERERQRQNREAARRFKEQQKLREILNAEQAVADWEGYVETLLSIHKNCSQKTDWSEINAQSKPNEPSMSNRNELMARAKRDTYTPSWGDKILGLTKGRIRKLDAALVEAQKQDKKSYEDAIEEYERDLLEWEEMQRISNGVLAKDPESYKEALSLYQPFSDIAELGARMAFGIEKEWIDIELYVNGDEVIPNYILTQTASGKLSKKSMPKIRFNELYQDHVCSAILKVAREIVAILPIEYVRVSAMSSMLNSQSGFLEEKPILSAIVRSETLSKINFQTVDPSECMRNFIHSMKFKKALGFEGVDKIELPSMTR